MDALYATDLRRKQAKRFKDADSEWLTNVTQFALLWNLDLTSLTNGITSLKSARGTLAGWQRQQQARVLALTMVECAQTFQGLLGRKTRDAVSRRHPNPDSLFAELNDLHARLRAIYTANNTQWRRLRNTIIAHRDEDAEVQLASMRNVGIEDIQSQGWTFIYWTIDLINWLTRETKEALSHRVNGTREI